MNKENEKGFYEPVMFIENSNNLLYILITKGMTLMSQFIFV